jgi:branched-chain amino acid transport system substrate-binding protein
MQKIKNVKKMLIFLIVSLIVFGLFLPQNIFAQSKQSNYKIGVVLSLSGLGEPFGIPEKNTLELLTEELNLKGGVDGRKIDLVFYDTQSSPDIAVRQVRKLLALEKPDAIIGPTTSMSAKALLPIVNTAKTPLIALAPFSDDNQSTHHWVFLTMQTHDIAIHKIYEDLKSRGGKNIAFLTSIDDEFARGGRRILNKLAPEYDLTVAADETVNIRDVSYLSALQKIKKTSPDAIVIWGLSDIGLSGRTISKLKIKSQVYHSHSVSALSYFFGTSLKYMEGDRLPANPMLIISQLPDNHLQKQLLDEFVKK